MKVRSWIALPILASLGLGAAPAAEKPSRPGKPVVATRLDKTAVWVGDVLKYEIEVIHDRDVEFIPESLSKESLRMTPFVIRDAIVSQRNWARDKRLLAVTLLLACYEISKSDLSIPSFNLYYFRRLAGTEGRENEAETLRIPAQKVGLRSTLSRGQNRPRDFKPLETAAPIPAWISMLLGTAGIAFLFVRGGRRAWSALRREKPKEARVRPRDQRRFVRDGLARLRALQAESPDGASFCKEVSEFLRQHLNQWLNLDADCLAAEEIEAALARAGIQPARVQEISAALRRCDAVRYGAAPMAQEAQGAMLETLEKIMTADKA